MRLNRFISALLLLPFAASAQSPFVAIDPELARTRMRVLEIDDGKILSETTIGGISEISTADVLGLAADRDTGAPTSNPILGVLTFEPSMLRLVDGRRLTGALSGESTLPEVLRWQHPALGKVDIPLELIDRLVLQRTRIVSDSADLLPRADRSDVVLLRNGDRLEGFVVELGRDAVVEVGGREISVPMESVYQVALANPAELWDGPMVWMSDGSVLGATEVGLRDGLFRLRHDPAPATEAEPALPARNATIRPEYVDAVVFDPRRLVALSSLVDSAAVLDQRSAFNAEPVTLAGEGALLIELPPNASRLSLEAVLPLRARAWGACELVLSTDGIERQRLPLTAGSPVMPAALDLSGAHTLELRLASGAFGRVQAEIEIREALVVID